MSNLDITEDKKPILDLIENKFDGNRLIIIEAPPGAGKTFLSVLCAKKLIEIGSIKVNQKVLLMTFSRNARSQLDKEAESVFVSDREKLKQIEITNFHSFFQKYVWAYRDYLGLPPELNLVWPQKRQKQIRSTISSSLNPTEETIEALSSCLEFQPNSFTPPHCPQKYLNIIPKILSHILTLNKNGHIAHQDLAYHFHVLIKNSPFILDTLRSKYPFLILDEYQDSSDFQDLIIRMLLGESNKAIIFADDMQMIHGWRGASRDRIKNLKKSFGCFSKELYQLPRYQDCPSLKSIFEQLRKVLKSNSCMTKINCSNSVFELRQANISEKFRKNISKLPDHLKARKINSYIAKSDVLNLVRNAGRNSGIAILLPFNEDVNTFKRIFREKNIPVKEISKGDKQHNFIGLLIENIDISTEQERKLFILEAMCYIDFGKIRDGLNWGNRLEKIKQKPSLKIAGNKKDIRKDLRLDEIVRDSQNFKGLLISLYRSVEKNKSRLIIDWEIFQILKKVIRKVETVKNVELKKLFSNVLLQEQYITAHKELKGIYVLNVHQAKGKEFDWIILPDVTESTFPSHNNDKRKLFYVAVTRAKQKVVIYRRDNQSKIMDIFCFL
jgi:DNA helicase-2/ATP-dependent DNA helicase PcrA